MTLLFSFALGYLCAHNLFIGIMLERYKLGTLQSRAMMLAATICLSMIFANALGGLQCIPV